MQIMAESLGLMLPGTALMPATCEDLSVAAEEAGKTAVALAKKGVKASDIVTLKSFENAIMVHAAISGSTNTLMHLPAIAHEFGIPLDADTFDRMHRGAHYLLNIRPAGEWPAQYFYYAGGVPRIMEEIKDHLHLDVMTVTGKTLGENLEDLKKNGFYEKCDTYLKKTGLKRTDIIRSFDDPIGTNGAIAILRGNIAPDGAVVKHSAVPKEMHKALLKARPFNCEEDAIHAILTHQIQPGDAVIIRYEGPRGQRYAGNVLSPPKPFRATRSFCQHCAADGRSLLRRKQGSRHRPYFAGSRTGRPHRFNRRKRPYRDRHSAAYSARRRYQRRKMQRGRSAARV